MMHGTINIKDKRMLDLQLLNKQPIDMKTLHDQALRCDELLKYNDLSSSHVSYGLRYGD